MAPFHLRGRVRRRCRRAILVAASLLGGCALGPRPAPPTVAVPAGWNAAPASAAWPDAAWWRAFGSPELDRLMALAAVGNQDVAGAQARVEQADARARIAGAALLPTLSAQPFASTIRSLSPNGVVRRYGTLGGVLSTSYEVDLWGKAGDARTAARLTADASRYALAVARLTMATAVAATYFNLLAVDDQIVVAEQDASAAESILAGMLVRQSHGLTTGLQVAQQRTASLQLAATIPALRAQRAHLLDALSILTGTLPEEIVVAPSSLATLTVPEVGAGLPSDLLLHRPDVRQAERELASAHANIEVARKSFLPSFGLTASGGAESVALASMTTDPTRIFSIGLSILQPIFEGGRLHGQLDYANARYRELAADYARTVQGAFAETEDALADVHAAGLTESRQREAVASADRALALARAAFQAGATDSLALLAAQQVAASAHRDYTHAALRRALAAISLYKALGGGWRRTDCCSD